MQYRSAASDDLEIAAVEGGCVMGPNGIVRAPIGSRSADSLQVGSPLDPRPLLMLCSPCTTSPDVHDITRQGR